MDVTVGRQWANTADDRNVLIHHWSKSVRLWVIHVASIVSCNRNLTVTISGEKKTILLDGILNISNYKYEICIYNQCKVGFVIIMYMIGILKNTIITILLILKHKLYLSKFLISSAHKKEKLLAALNNYTTLNYCFIYKLIYMK